jgi:GntR family transcriptional regulator
MIGKAAISRPNPAPPAPLAGRAINIHLVREPVYQQLNQALRALLCSEEFPVGARFLTERQISQRFGVSRATANKALSNLVSEGLLEFRKGVGTFVRGRKMDYNLRALVSFTEEAQAAGKRPATRVLAFERMSCGQAPEGVSIALHAGLDEMLFYMERLRLADDLPVILEKRYVIAAHCPGLGETDAGGSLYSVWSRTYGLHLVGAGQTIRAVSLHGADARLLEVREGSAGMLVTSVGYLDGDVPLWFERTLYRGDAYEFHNRLGSHQAATHAAGRFLNTPRRTGE